MKNIYNKFELPERRKIKANKWREEEEFLGSMPKPKSGMYSIPLEYGKATADMDREVVRELTYVDGRFFLDGREVRPKEAGRAVVASGKEQLVKDKRLRFSMHLDEILAETNGAREDNGREQAVNEVA